MKFEDISSQISDVSQGYHFHKPPDFVVRLQEVLARVWRWILDLLDFIFHRGHHFGGADSRSLSSFLQMLVYAAGVLAAAVLVVVLLRRFAEKSRSGGRLRKGAQHVEELLDCQGWKNEAARLSSAHDYRGACRALYLSLLQCMHENGIAEFAPAKTNYEYSYALSTCPDIQRGFRLLSGQVEVLWFGNKQADSQDYQESLQILGGLEPLILAAAAAKRAKQEAAL